MESPTIKTTATDRDRNIRYEVLAYRTLTEAEMIMTIRMLWGQKKGKRPKPNSTITVMSIIGAQDYM